jgi:hypothetical protein
MALCAGLADSSTRGLIPLRHPIYPLPKSVDSSSVESPRRLSKPPYPIIGSLASCLAGWQGKGPGYERPPDLTGLGDL